MIAIIRRIYYVNSLFKEFIFLFFISFVLLSISLTMFRYEVLGEDLALYVTLLFVISLIVFHYVFAVLRNFFSSESPKIIDYMYLSVATLGLLGSSEVTLNKFQTRSQIAIEQISSSLSYLSGMAKNAAENLCSVGNENCEYFNNIQSESNNILKLLQVNANTIEIEKNIAYIWKNLDMQTRYNRKNNIYVQETTKILENFNIYKNRPRFSASISLLGKTGAAFFLISIALALRITKVSVELFRLFKP